LDLTLSANQRTARWFAETHQLWHDCCDRKPAHAKASFAKLHASEMVGRVIDQAL
jgi:hypothetical protein